MFAHAHHGAGNAGLFVYWIYYLSLGKHSFGVYFLFSFHPVPWRQNPRPMVNPNPGKSEHAPIFIWSWAKSNELHKRSV